MPRTSLGACASAAAVLAWLGLLGAAALDLEPDAYRWVLAGSPLVAAGVCWARVLLRAQQRLVWSLFALGVSGYAVGYALLLFVSTGEAGGPFGLNLSDTASLLLYPCVLAGIALLSRERETSWRLGALLDGALVVLACAGLALQWAVRLFPTLLSASGMETFYTLVYPVAVASLLVAVVAALATTPGWIDGPWLLLLIGFAAMTVGEFVFAARVASGTFVFGTVLDALFIAGPVGVALAAWAPPGRTAGIGRHPLATMAVPALSTLAALTVLVDRSDVLPVAAVGLAAAAVVCAVLRTALFVRQEHLLAQRTLEAKTDPLTGLLNRRALLAELAARLASPDGVTLMIVDLDRFKEVNDTLGHAAGDALLVQLADRLATVDETALVARLGGDEFALLVPGTAHLETAVLATQVREVLEQTAEVLDHQVIVGASIGIAESADEQARSMAGELMRRADVALYRAKREGTGIERWRPALDEGARDRLALVGDLRAALLVDDQLLVHLQPQHDPRTRAVVGIEALVRWRHPRRGLLYPEVFIEVAERSGLLTRLTERVIALAVTEAAVLAGRGRAVPVAVNIGAPDLLDPRFASRVAQALDAGRLPPGLLRLEVTETVVMTDPARALRTLLVLSHLGIKLSLDDYGTGLSSLTYLRTLPVDELKIDRSFVAQVTADPASRLIVLSTIALAHGLGLTVVAEGVEDQATLRALADAGCDVVQGYLLGRPVPAAELGAPHGTDDLTDDLQPA